MKVMTMKWTSEPPRKTGWYFYQRIDFPGYPIRVGVVKTVYYNDKGYLAVCENWETNNGFCIADITCKHRWAGPIPEPVEPEE